MIDYTLDPRVEALRRSITEFVAKELLPIEAEPSTYDEHDNIRIELLDALRAKAKQAGLWALQMPNERGGHGLPVVGLAACYEAMNYSIFGPVVFNSAAPDDGNMILLEKIATPAQKERWLQPIVDGKVRSAFAMTEPHPGSGSDPAMMLTTASRRADRWIISGRKWFITGAGKIG